MNYAILSTSGLTYAQQMKEIVRCISGQVSSTNDLQFASKTASVVSISDITSKWTVHTATSIEAGTSATLAGYVFSAPCQTVGKTKWGAMFLTTSSAAGPAVLKNGIQLVCGTGFNGTLPTPNSTVLTNALTTSATIANGGISTWNQTSVLTNQSACMQKINSATNASWTDVGGMGGRMLHSGSSVGTKIYIFWNSNMIAIHCTSDQSFQTIGEFPETTTSKQKSDIPVFLSTAIELTNPNTVAVSSQPDVPIGLGVYSSLFDNSTVSVVTMSNSVAIAPLTVATGIDTTGKQITPVCPILINKYAAGHGMINVSSLSGIYFTVKGTAKTGDIVSVGASTFMCLNTTYFGTFLIKLS